MNKNIRDYINLIETAQQGVAEGNMDGKVADIKGQIAELEAEQEENEFGSYAYDTVNGELQYLYAKLDKAEKGVAEGLNEFAPDGFNGGDDDEGFSPDIAKMAQEDGFTKGASLADGATLERAITINHWHDQHGGMYKQHFAKGFKQGRMNKIRHDNKQYNLNLKLMKDGSIRRGEQK
jgi:hypothetical protein